jgi:hypothetical protein
MHRDIKPSNVIMEGRTPILIDFGLARVADDSRITMNGWLLGTPGYLAPEILYGEDATAASDVHAWAATVAYAGTGRAPFGRGPSVAIMDRVRRGEHDLTGLDPMVLDLVEDALAPEAADRPSLDEVRDWIEDLASEDHVPGEPRAPRTHAMPVTLPYVAAAQQDVDAPSHLGTSAAPLAAPVPAVPAAPVGEPVHWSDDWRTPPDGFDDDALAGDWRDAGTAPQRSTRVLPDGSPEHVSDYGPPARERVPAGERFRRAVSLLALGGVVAGGIVFAPYVALAALFVAVWLLRSGSLAAASAGNRRSRRGVKWYDGIQLLLAAPWHVVAGFGGSLLLFLWSIGIASAIALLCFAASISFTTSLAVIGAAFAMSTWWGPGSERVRSPVHRVVDPLARRGVPWLLVTLLVAAGGSALGAAVSAQGTSWTPYDSAPLSDVRLPGWL